MLARGEFGVRPHLAAPAVGDAYEFGTEAYRAGIYAAAVRESVPPGVPVITSDDPAAWRAAAWLAGRNPFIGVVHGQLDEYDALVRRYAAHASAFVGVSQRVTRRVRAVVGHDRIPALTIPCGIRLPELPRRTGARGGPVRLVWVGRMREEAKRISDLPKIATSLRDRGVPFVLDIMGDGEDRPALLAELARLKLTDVVRVRPWGAPADVQSLLSAGDVLVCHPTIGMGCHQRHGGAEPWVRVSPAA